MRYGKKQKVYLGKSPERPHEGSKRIDTETGVNYLFVQGGYAGGLTPLLDKNGKPVITPPYEIIG